MSAQDRKRSARRTVRNIGSTNKPPFGTYAEDYAVQGWYPHPLPYKRKAEPQGNTTGHKSNLLERMQSRLENWLRQEKFVKGNIAVWLQPGIVGIDVDGYKEDGLSSLEMIENEVGPLPETWTSSARADGVSGIRFYRVPEGLAWPGKVGDGIETVHAGHRYAVVSPSVHPDGMCYLWYEPGASIDGTGKVDPPMITEMAELGDAHIDYFTHGRFSNLLKEKKFRTRKQSETAITNWLEKHDRGGKPCGEMLRRVEHWCTDLDGASAHDTVRDGTFNIVSLAAEGHAGLRFALDKLHDAFIAEVSQDDRDGTARGPIEAELEWGRLHDAAVKKTMARQDTGDFEGLPDRCRCSALRADGRPKPKLNVGGYNMTEVLPGLYEAIGAQAVTDWYGVYLQSGSLVDLGPHGVQQCTVPSLRGIVAENVECFKNVGEDAVPLPAVPPRELLETTLESRHRFSYLPELRGTADTPFWGMVNGSPVLFHENGYHAEVGIFLRMDPLLSDSVQVMEMDPPESHVKRAVLRIDEMVVDFPFVGPADRATFFAALLLPFVRDLIDGPTPLHLFDAPRPGTGKSLLVDVIGMVACGAIDGAHGYQSIGVRDGHDRNTELSKEITSRMRQGSRVLNLDNVTGELDSSELAKALTSAPNYSSRLLGSNKTVEVPNRTLWTATGNNVAASPDIMRRIVSARLDTKTADPARGRSFVNENLLQWVASNRPMIVWSLLTLVANWIAEGMPSGEERMGSYEAWARVVGGILAAAGIDGLLTNEGSFRARAASGAQSLDGLVLQWADQLGAGERVSPAQIANLEAAEDLVPPDARARDRAIGRLVSGALDTLIEGYYIRKTILDGRQKYYLDNSDGSKTRFARRNRRRRGKSA